MLYKLLIIILKIHCVTLNYNKDIIKLKSVSCVLNDFGMGLADYTRRIIQYLRCACSLLLFIGTAVAVVERNLRAACYCHKEIDSWWKKGT